MESGQYRTLDGNAEFSFNFVKVDDFYEVDAIYIPVEIRQDVLRDFCENSERNGYRIILDQKPNDIHTARLMAGEWAEKSWGSNST